MTKLDKARLKYDKEHQKSIDLNTAIIYTISAILFFIPFLIHSTKTEDSLWYSIPLITYLICIICLKIIFGLGEKYKKKSWEKMTR